MKRHFCPFPSTTDTELNGKKLQVRGYLSCSGGKGTDCASNSFGLSTSPKPRRENGVPSFPPRQPPTDQSQEPHAARSYFQESHSSLGVRAATGASCVGRQSCASRERRQTSRIELGGWPLTVVPPWPVLPPPRCPQIVLKTSASRHRPSTGDLAHVQVRGVIANNSQRASVVLDESRPTARLVHSHTATRAHGSAIRAGTWLDPGGPDDRSPRAGGSRRLVRLAGVEMMAGAGVPAIWCRWSVQGFLPATRGTLPHGWGSSRTSVARSAERLGRMVRPDDEGALSHAGAFLCRPARDLH